MGHLSSYYVYDWSHDHYKLKTAHFLYFLLITAQNWLQYWQNNHKQLKDLIELLHRMILLRDFEVIVCEILMVEISKLMSQLKNSKPLYFQGLTSW